MRRPLLLPLSLALVCLVSLGSLAACDEDDPPGGGAGGSAGFGGAFNGGFGNGTGAGASSTGSNLPVVGCSSTQDGTTGCTTTRGPLTQQQIDDVTKGCLDDGDTVLRDETCARSASQGCCIASVAGTGTRITTCVADPNLDQTLARTQCEQQGHYWSTAIGDNPPETGAGGSGAGGSGAAGSGSGSKFKGACYQADQFQCTGYTITNPQLDASCTQGGGTLSTTCPAQGLRGCCIQGGYVAVCYYEGGKQTGDQTMEEFCKAGGNEFTATAP